jgi:SDR family mycofactocin-dependent oxidoreductase
MSGETVHSGRFEGKVAFITGAARGQGRSHALGLAAEGADIVAVDLCAQIESVNYPMSTPEDLAETVRQVQSLDRQIVAVEADVRDQGALEEAAARGVAELGSIDVVLANAGISSVGTVDKLEETALQEMLDITLGGVWKTVRATSPHMIDAGNGGAVVLTSSFCGLRGSPNVGHYTAAKHGVIGAMKSMANELGPHGIRVNTVCPGMVWTPMVDNEEFFKLFCPDVANPGKADLEPVAAELNPLGVPWAEASDITNAVLWLASEEARCITAAVIPIDAGWSNR